MYRGCADPVNLPWGVRPDRPCVPQAAAASIWWFCNGDRCNDGNLYGEGRCAADYRNRNGPQGPEQDGTPPGSEEPGVPAVTADYRDWRPRPYRGNGNSDPESQSPEDNSVVHTDGGTVDEVQWTPGDSGSSPRDKDKRGPVWSEYEPWRRQEGGSSTGGPQGGLGDSSAGGPQGGLGDTGVTGQGQGGQGQGGQGGQGQGQGGQGGYIPGEEGGEVDCEAAGTCSQDGPDSHGDVMTGETPVPGGQTDGESVEHHHGYTEIEENSGDMPVKYKPDSKYKIRFCSLLQP